MGGERERREREREQTLLAQLMTLGKGKALK